MWRRYVSVKPVDPRLFKDLLEGLQLGFTTIRCTMTAKSKSVEEMTPEEREAEHLRQVRELIEATKSGVLKVKKKSPPDERKGSSTESK